MCPLRHVKTMRNEKIHLVKLGRLSNTETLTQETKTSLPILRDICS